MEKEKLVITIRVPFCTGHPVFLQSKSYGENIATLQRYRIALEKEIASAAEELEEFDIQAVRIVDCSVGLFGPGALDDFLRALRTSLPMAENAQWILDMMPGDFSDLMLVGPQNAKIDRLHVIIPTGNKEELSQTKTSFSLNIVDHTIEYLAGITSMEKNMETLVGIPGQTPESLCATLEKLLKASPTEIHLAKFSNNRFSEEEKKIWEESTDWVNLYEKAHSFLTERGYLSYGTDHHYCIPGHERADATDAAASFSHMGFGVGAVTRMEGLSYHNTLNLKLYVAHSDDPGQIARLD